ncbi:MAG: hypothetical protein V1745_02840 [Patescibacteria group bacterium]
MKTSSMRILFACLSLVMFGAGCSLPFGKTASAPQAEAGTLRQPTAAQAPTAEPVIPPEAANVPRPY